jgi:hypothetical protein
MHAQDAAVGAVQPGQHDHSIPRLLSSHHQFALVLPTQGAKLIAAFVLPRLFPRFGLQTDPATRIEPVSALFA